MRHGPKIKINVDTTLHNPQVVPIKTASNTSKCNKTEANKNKLQRTTSMTAERATNEEMRAWRKLDRPLYKKLNFQL